MAGGHPLYLDSAGWKLWFAAPVLIRSLFTGRMLARWAPGRELAACLVYAIWSRSTTWSDVRRQRRVFRFVMHSDRAGRGSVGARWQASFSMTTRRG